MDVLIIGAAGMLGAKLAQTLLRDGSLGSDSIGTLSLVDVVTPRIPDTPAAASVTVDSQVADLSEPGTATKLLAARPGVIFHLAAIVSGEAELDFDKGYRINLDGTRALFDAIRGVGDGYCPRVVFSSSIAVFGAPFPDSLPDDFHSTPLTSYGTQKAIGELLLNDYTRRGILDGIGLRLPTICIRPGKPNLAASGFFSNILREPINGQEAVLPVPESVRHWFASPRAAIGFLLHAATLPGGTIGVRRNLSLPGLSATVGEQIASLGRVVGDQATALIRREPDPAIMAIVSNWAESLDAQRAEALGFVAEKTFDEIIQVYLDDEVGAA